MPLISLPWTSLASDVQGREISGMTTTMGRSRVRGAVFGANDIAQLQVLEKDAVRHHGDAPLGPSHEPIHERQCAPRHCGVVLFLCEHGVLFLNDLRKVHARPRAFERRSRRAPLRRVDSNALAAQLTRYALAHGTQQEKQSESLLHTYLLAQGPVLDQRTACVLQPDGAEAPGP